MQNEKQVIEEAAAPGPLDLAPPDYLDPVIEAYKKDVDRSLLRENLKLSVEERIRKAQNFHKTVEELRAAGKRHRLAAAKEEKA